MSCMCGPPFPAVSSGVTSTWGLRIHMVPGSVVPLRGHDDLMDARQVQTMLEHAGHIKVQYNQELTHGEFLIKSEVKHAIMEELHTMQARSGNAVVGLARPVLRRTITLAPARNAIQFCKLQQAQCSYTSQGVAQGMWKTTHTSLCALSLATSQLC